MKPTFQKELFDEVFGKDSTGNSLEERASTSKKVFVRSIIQVAEYSPLATGYTCNAIEALQVYEFERLLEVEDKGVSVLLYNKFEPEASVSCKLKQKSMSYKDLSKILNIPIDDLIFLKDIHIARKVYEYLC